MKENMKSSKIKMPPQCDETENGQAPEQIDNKHVKLGFLKHLRIGTVPVGLYNNF